MTEPDRSSPDAVGWNERAQGIADPPPLVTIVMANYNGTEYIEHALRSALAQTLHELEIIVADDASTDDSADRVASVARLDTRVRLIRAATNAGPGAARNLCLESARGRWIAVMDSDDLMHKERLARLIALADSDGADIVADDLLIFHENPNMPPEACLRGSAALSARWIDAADYVRANVLYGGDTALGYLKPLFRRSLIETCHLRYDVTLRIAEDYDFVLRLLIQGARFRVYPQLLYFYRKHSRSISHRLSRATLQPMLVAHDRLAANASTEDRQLGTALAMRRASLERALHFDDLVSALKQRRWLDATVAALRQPHIALMLRGPLVDRLRHFGSGVASAPAGGGNQACILSRQRIVGNTNGSSVYLLSICTALSRSGLDLHLLCPSPVVFGRWPVLWLRPDMRVFRSIRVRGSVRFGPLLVATSPGPAIRALIGLLGRLASRLGIPAGRLNKPAAYAISQPWTREDLLFVARHARERANIILADYAFLTEGIPYALRPDAVSLVVMHDLFSSRSTQFSRLGAADSVATIDRQTEMALLGNADAIIAIQSDEAAIVRQCLPNHRVILAPIAVVPVRQPQPGVGRSLLFIGSKTAPNVLGLRWFLESVWPLVRTALPDAVLRIAGTVCGTVSAAPGGVQLLGAVRDLDSIYREAAVVISPLQVGSGLKIKLVEALGHGKSVVATRVTLQGVEEEARDIVSVADTASDFAAAVVAELSNEELRMAHAKSALELARARFSPAACYADLLGFISTALPRPGTGAEAPACQARNAPPTAEADAPAHAVW